MTQDGRSLEHASAELKADKEVVLAAVTQDRYAIAYATPELKADKELVLFALGMCYLFTDEAVRAAAESTMLRTGMLDRMLTHFHDGPYGPYDSDDSYFDD